MKPTTESRDIERHLLDVIEQERAASRARAMTRSPREVPMSMARAKELNNEALQAFRIGAAEVRCGLQPAAIFPARDAPAHLSG